MNIKIVEMMNNRFLLIGILVLILTVLGHSEEPCRFDDNRQTFSCVTQSADGILFRFEVDICWRTDTFGFSEEEKIKRIDLVKLLIETEISLFLLQEVAVENSQVITKQTSSQRDQHYNNFIQRIKSKHIKSKLLDTEILRIDIKPIS